MTQVEDVPKLDGISSRYPENSKKLENQWMKDFGDIALKVNEMITSNKEKLLADTNKKIQINKAFSLISKGLLPLDSELDQMNESLKSIQEVAQERLKQNGSSVILKSIFEIANEQKRLEKEAKPKQVELGKIQQQLKAQAEKTAPALSAAQIKKLQEDQEKLQKELEELEQKYAPLQEQLDAIDTEKTIQMQQLEEDLKLMEENKKELQQALGILMRLLKDEEERISKITRTMGR